jgi:alpha-D-ribose 1-methylphosphonate 5-phosphate C-P lyase
MGIGLAFFTEQMKVLPVRRAILKDLAVEGIGAARKARSAAIEKILFQA